MMSARNVSLVLALIAFLSHSTVCGQQTFQFSQYMFNGLVINPAYAGADEAMSLTFYNRSQWTGVEGSPSTQSLSAHTLFARQRVGAGLTIVNDRIGVHQNLIISASGAYHMRVSESGFLSFGLQAGYGHRESDYQSLGATINSDPRAGATSLSQNMLDFGAGIYLRSPRLHVGISAPRLMPGKLEVNDTLTVRFSSAQMLLFSKVKFDLSPSVAIEPGFLVKYFPGLPVSFDVNTNFIFNRVLIAGVSYRKSESVDFMLRAQVTPQLQMGYGYDHTIGDVSSLSGASHELMVNYLFRFTRSNVTSPR